MSQHPRPNHNINPQDFQAQAQRAEAQGDWQTAAKLYARALEQRNTEVSLINSVQAGLSARLEMQAIYDLVGDSLRDTFNAQVVMISQYDPQTDKIFHHYAIERGQHLNIPGWRNIDSSRKRIAETCKPYMINLQEILKVVAQGKMSVIPGTELPHTWLGVPMLVGDQVCGIVSLQNLDKENAFSKSDIELLNALTNSMSQSLENARLFNETQRLLNLIEEEMEIARHTQQSILPAEFPKHKGYDIAASIIPARAVGGDFFDFIPLKKQRLALVVGDVSDKGLPAALFMALTFSLLRAEAARTADARQVLINVNRDLLKMNPLGMYVTLLYCVLDLRTGTLECTRAGHPSPILLDSYGHTRQIEMQEGQPLGILEDFTLDQQEITIPHGGLALLYSDGLSEACNASGTEFGEAHIAEELSTHRHKNAKNICSQLWDAIEQYSSPIPHQDDFTTLVAKRH
ncbi:MAG: GAF domain-containing SpoIIE family protein phosphatase [Anaerolineales bacterium]